MSERSWADHPQLRAWLRERAEAFPQWAAAHPGVWDFSVESLDRLQAVLRAEFSSTEQIKAVRDTLAVTVPAWYFGEVCVRAGGAWKHSYADPIEAETWSGPFVGIEGAPLMEPDYDNSLFKDAYEDYLPYVEPVPAVCDGLLFPEALRDSATEFANAGERINFVLALADSPRLRAWLREREEAFPQWAAAHPGVWDFSPDSIDRLQAVIMTEFPSRENIRSMQHTLAVTVPAWYFGEACVRAGAVWKYDPVGPDDPNAFAQGPSIGVPGDPWDDFDYESYEDDEAYLPSENPIAKVRGVFSRSPDWPLRSVVEAFDTWRRDTDGGKHNPVSTRTFLIVAAQYRQQRITQQLGARHPRLRAWLQEQQEAFPHWAATHPGDWDFSPNSLDQLQATLQAEFPTTEDLTTAQTTPAMTVPTWYLGEVCKRAGATWKHHYNTPTEHTAPLDAETLLAPLIGTPEDIPNDPDEDHPNNTHPPDTNPATEIHDILTNNPDRQLRTIAEQFHTWRHSTGNDS